MYALVFWSALAVAGLAIACSYFALAKRRALTSWDAASLVTPFVLWWALALLNLRTKSLSNLIEPFALVPLLAVIVVIRTFVHVARSEQSRAKLALIASLIVSVLLYVFVPVLPE